MTTSTAAPESDTWLTRFVRASDRTLGVPARFIVPVIGCMAFLYLGFLGLAWDLGWHIDVGRDRLIAPPHMLIVIGLQSTAIWALLHGILPGPSVRGDITLWKGRLTFAPGAVELIVCSILATIAFPLDALWHYLFGKDNTLWGPTHVLMIAGGTMCAIGLMMLYRQACQLGTPTRLLRYMHFDVQVAGALLLGLSGLQGEYDYGAPQFPLWAQPALIAATAGFALACARGVLGRWGALKVVAFYLAVRWLMWFIVGDVVGYHPPEFPQYVVEGCIVEAAAFIFPRSPLRWSLLAGVLLGTVGVAAEWWWSTVYMPHAWVSSMATMALVTAVVSATGAAVLGARIGQAIGTGNDSVGIPRAAVIGAVIALVIGMGVTIARLGPDGTSAVITARPDGNGRATITVRLSPPDAARGAQYFEIMSLYGKHPRELTSFRRAPGARPGTYVTRQPVPIGEPWVSFFRLERGAHMLSGNPMTPRTDVAAQPELLYRGELRRENYSPESKDAPRWLTITSYLLCAVIVLAWGLLIAWALRMQEDSRRDPGEQQTVS